MKYALLFMILLPCTLSAQFVRGDKFIGGSMGFTIRQSGQQPFDDNVSKNNSFSLKPEIGFFLGNNFAVGSELLYSEQFNKSTSNDLVSLSKTFTYGLSIFAKKYYTVADRFSFALSGKLRYGLNRMHTISPTGSGESSFNSVGGALSPTFIFFPSAKWGLEAGLGELSYWYGKNDGALRGRHELNFRAGLLSFGLKYYILNNRRE